MENSVPLKMVQKLIYLIIFKESNKRRIGKKNYFTSFADCVIKDV